MVDRRSNFDGSSWLCECCGGNGGRAGDSAIIAATETFNPFGGIARTQRRVGTLEVAAGAVSWILEHSVPASSVTNDLVEVQSGGGR